MEHYVYHFVPPEMKGHVLYPLNQLKTIYPDTYRVASKKYTGREEVMKNTIPALNCLWNDVLHLSPVPPEAIQKAYSDLGKSIKLNAYKINANMLDPEKTIIYLYKYGSQEEKYKKDNWSEFTPENLNNIQELPERTKQYYKQCFDEGRQPLLFGWVPHVLYEGSIDISNCEIIG